MKQVCVIGLSQFGSHLARQLVKFGCQVLVIDSDEERINDIRDDVHRALIGDARSFEMLESVIPDTIDQAVISLGEANIEPSILCALHLKQIGVTRILSTARNDDHAQMMLRFASGVMGHLYVSRVATGRKMGYAYEIHGTKGAIRFDQEDQNSIWLYRADGPEA